MLLPQKNSTLRGFLGRARLLSRFTLPALFLGSALPAAAGAWTDLSLPPLLSTVPHFGAAAIGHLADGRFVYGNNNRLFLQDGFGAATATPYAAPPGVDPGFIAELSPGVAALGAGMFGPTNLYQFNPLTPAAPAYAGFATLSNYAGVRYDAGSVLLTGLNGTGGSNAVSYVALNGTTRLLVDQVSTFSAGLAVDGAGNVWVGDNDDFSVYRFGAAQVAAALAGNTTLSLSDGTLVHTFGANVVGTLAVDGLGRLWAAGFGAPGLSWWDPSQNIGGTLLPQGAGGSYRVAAFEVGGTAYMSYVWQAGFSTGDAVVYGYAPASAVPEPATAAALAAAVVLAVVLRPRPRRNNARPS